MKVTLDSIREAAEKKFGSYDIELGEGSEVKLLNPLRLSKENRKKLMSYQDEANSENSDVDQEDVIEDMLRLIAESPKAADLLIKALDGDLAVQMQIFDDYAKATSLGEASASES